MDQQMVSQALGEVGGLVKSMLSPDGVTVYCVDAAASDAQKIFRADQIKLSGGGGTDMRIGIDKALANKRDRPDVVIVLTDGYTPWPERKPPRVNIVVGLVPPAGERMSREDRVVTAVPDWAKTVLIQTSPTARPRAGGGPRP
jgi:predicted metal-dependent peptidase